MGDWGRGEAEMEMDSSVMARPQLGQQFSQCNLVSRSPLLPWESSAAPFSCSARVPFSMSMPSLLLISGRDARENHAAATKQCHPESRAAVGWERTPGTALSPGAANQRWAPRITTPGLSPPYPPSYPPSIPAPAGLPQGWYPACLCNWDARPLPTPPRRGIDFFREQSLDLDSAGEETSRPACHPRSGAGPPCVLEMDVASGSGGRISPSLDAGLIHTCRADRTKLYTVIHPSRK